MFLGGSEKMEAKNKFGTVAPMPRCYVRAWCMMAESSCSYLHCYLPIRQNTQRWISFNQRRFHKYVDACSSTQRAADEADCRWPLVNSYL